MSSHERQGVSRRPETGAHQGKRRPDRESGDQGLTVQPNAPMIANTGAGA
jgi:hypothetical protein